MAAHSLPDYHSALSGFPSPRSISFSPNGKQVYISAANGKVFSLVCGALTIRPFKWRGHDVQGMAFHDASRVIYVVDREYGVIGEFDMKGGMTHSRTLDLHATTNGPLNRVIGTPSAKSLFFNEPFSGIAYIADDQKRRPWVFDLDIAKLHNHAEVIEKEGRLGVFSSIRRDFVPHISALQWPSDITLDGNGHMYVADTWNNRIVCFSEKGEFVCELGRFGKRDGEFQIPSGVCWDTSNQTLIVADSGNARIQIFTSDLKHVISIGHRGKGKGELLDIAGIAVDPKNGIIYVTDPKMSRVSAFSREGHFLFDFGSDRLKSPMGIALCPSKGQLWVADTESGECHIWSLPSYQYEEVEWIKCPEKQEEVDAKARRQKAKEDLSKKVVPSSPAFDPNVKTLLKLTIINGELRRGTDMDGKSDPYVVVLLGKHPLGKTPYCKRTLNPIWNHSICFPAVPSEQTEVTFQIYDHDYVMKDDFVGVANWKVPTEIPTAVTLIFYDPNSNQRAGQIQIRIDKVK